MDMLRKKNTRTLSELEQIPYQPQVYAIPIEQRKRESKLLADAVEFQPKLYQLIERLATAEELSTTASIYRISRRSIWKRRCGKW